MRWSHVVNSSEYINWFVLNELKIFSRILFFFFFLNIKEGCLSLMKTVSLVELNWFRGRYICIFVIIGTFMDNWEVIEMY